MIIACQYDTLCMWYYNDKMTIRYYDGAFNADIQSRLTNLSEVREALSTSSFDIIEDTGDE